MTRTGYLVVLNFERVGCIVKAVIARKLVDAVGNGFAGDDQVIE